MSGDVKSLAAFLSGIGVASPPFFVLGRGAPEVYVYGVGAFSLLMIFTSFALDELHNPEN